MYTVFEEIQHILVSHQLNISHFILYALQQEASYHPLVQDLCAAWKEIVTAFSQHQEVCGAMRNWSRVETSEVVSEEIDQLASDEAGWHFLAGHAEPYQLQEFDLVDMAREMRSTAPHLWEILDIWLRKGTKGDENSESESDDEAIEAAVNDLGDASATTNRKRKRQTATAQKRRHATIISKKVLLSSILMQGRNQKANWLQSMCGIFLHAMHAPQKLVDSLAHMGISISQSTIHNSLHSLGINIISDAKQVGQTLSAAYAYDNLDIEFKSSVPTVEKPGDMLKHFTTSMIFPLQHGITADDLRCSRYLWDRSRLNVHAFRDLLPPKPTSHDLMLIHPHTRELDENNMTVRDRFNAWKFLHDLCHHGPEEFRGFAASIGEPDPIEKIPLTKTPIIPLRTTSDNNSQVAGNISALTHILAQVGVGDPRVAHADSGGSQAVVDVSDHVVLFYGDLGTGEKIDASLERRSIEQTPWLRLQFVVFVLGLFHLKMACVDALWKVFIQPRSAQEDETCLMKDVSILRPRETGSIASKPGFRRMHQVIQHAGICRRLDCWRVEVQKREPAHSSLKLFAMSKPSLDYLKALANHLAMNYTARKEKSQIFDLRSKPSATRDKQYENGLLLNEYFCLYEELTFAMNHGDVGRVESCFMPWVWIFKATGKHKYVKHMMKYLSNVHFLYPPGLRKAVRYSILINPSGKPGCFRAPDWCLELNNLYTKTKYGGTGVNYTEQRIINESVLIQIYRDLHLTFERNLALGHLTTKHAEPDMTRTFEVMMENLKKTRPHEMIPGRGSKHQIPNLIDEGQCALLAAEGPEAMDTDDVAAEEEVEVTLADVTVEIGV
ncbi:hypothetical protein BC835DRAFT_1304794 [Cytidiella melzeri]|nr:hypothetical protein BC835DRAFT_1304794 [Cytidiella melzeri]